MTGRAALLRKRSPDPLHNTISHTDNSTGAQRDCMQTFAHRRGRRGQPRHVLIDGNPLRTRRQHVSDAEWADTPRPATAGASECRATGSSATTTCQTRPGSSQTLMVDDVQHLTVIGNTWAAGPDHAVGLQNQPPTRHILGNHLDGSIPCDGQAIDELVAGRATWGRRPVVNLIFLVDGGDEQRAGDEGRTEPQWHSSATPAGSRASPSPTTAPTTNRRRRP